MTKRLKFLDSARNDILIASTMNAAMTDEDSANSKVSIQIFDEFWDAVPHEWLEAVAIHVLAEAAPPATAVGVVIADDKTVRELNARHRGIDETTDVLAFAYAHEGEYQGDSAPRPDAVDPEEFIMPPLDVDDVGEVIISYPKAELQAIEGGHSTTQELAILLAHGILHLLGYDHMEPDDEAVMKAEEVRVLSGIPRHE